MLLILLSIPKQSVIRSTNSCIVSLPIYLFSLVISPYNSPLPFLHTSNNSLPIKQKRQQSPSGYEETGWKKQFSSKKQESTSLRSLPSHYPLFPRSSLTPRFSLSKALRIREIQELPSLPNSRTIPIRETNERKIEIKTLKPHKTTREGNKKLKKPKD